MELRTAIKHIAAYITLAVLFGIGVFYFKGSQAGMEFTMCYLIEMCLSMDNLFVFSLIFGYFATPKKSQYRVLYWGILGAVVLRLLFILSSIAAIKSLTWILYLFGAFLIWTGLKMLLASDEEPTLEDNKIIKFCHKHLPITKEYYRNAFWISVHVNGSKTIRYFTPLFIALIVIEISDILFAFDSIPAAFAVTLDPFVILSANIFAILGLRSMYFVLAAMIERFEYMKYAISLVLVLIGAKMVINHYYAAEIITTPVSLMATVLMLGSSIIYSWRKTK